MKDFTIIIPTYNGAHRIHKCLEGIKNLIIPENLTYEILCIDNNCIDNTIDVINSYDLNIRIIKEEKQGLLFARNRGIEEADSNWIFFIDDDIKVEPNWVISFLDLKDKNPDLGLAAAKLKFPEEYIIPELINHYSAIYAVPKYIDIKSNFLSSRMFLSKECYMSLKENGYEQKLVGRSKNPYAGGEDIEYSLSLQYTSFKCYENKNTFGTHYLEQSRLNKENLLNLKKSSGYILFKLAPYRYSRKFKNTSYYFYLLRTITSLYKILFMSKDIRDVFLIEKIELLKWMTKGKKEYQDFEKEIKLAKWNIYSKKA